MARTGEKKASRAARDKQPDGDSHGGEGGGAEEAPVEEQELASYLEERIKPGLNRGSIPMLARSIARELAQADFQRADDDEDEDDEAAGLEADLHTLQQHLGEDWTLFYAVHDGDAWLTAETQDATQRVEAASAEVLVKAVALLTQGGGRSAARHSGREDDGDGD